MTPEERAAEVVSTLKSEGLREFLKARCADQIREAVADAAHQTWKDAAKLHQRHCYSFPCRENKDPCNEYETYMIRARGPGP